MDTRISAHVKYIRYPRFAMNTKTTLQLFTFILSLILFSGMVSAVIEVNTYAIYRDFSIATKSNRITTCSCAQSMDEFTITNSGSYDAIYTITTEDARATFSDNGFSLAPQESRSVIMYLRNACSESKESITITIKNNLGTQKSFSKEINTEKCQNIELRVQNINTTLQPCTPMSFKIYVKNIGPFTDDYEVFDDTPEREGIITYSQRTFTLTPNQTAMINAKVSLDCAFYGREDITFRAKSIKNDLQASITQNIDVAQSGFEYQIAIKNTSMTNYSDNFPLQVCNRLWQHEIPITIKNSGVVDNNFTIKTTGMPKFLQLRDIDRTVSVKSGQSKTIYLYADTHEFKYQNEVHDFNLIVESQLGNIVKSQKIRVNNLLCFEHIVDIIGNEKNSAKNPVDTCEGTVYMYTGEVKNNGMFTEKVLLSLKDSPSSVALSKGNMTIKPGTSEKFTLFITGPATNQKQNITVMGTLAIGFTSQDTIWIQGHDKQTCHSVDISDANAKINYDAKTVTLHAKNTGMVNGTYDVFYTGDTILKLETKTFNLKPHEEKEIKFKTNTQSVTEGTYTGTVTVTHEDSGAFYQQKTSVTLKDKSPLRKALEYFAFGGACRQFSLVQIIIILFIIAAIIFFTIRGPHYPYKFWNRVKYKLPILAVLVAVFILGLILVIMLAGFPKSYSQAYNLTQDYTTLKFEVLQDRTFALDAGNYFTDADNNTLTYRVKDSTHIKTRINKNIVTFYPDLGWSGTEKFKITAIDNQGGSAESPYITLQIIAKPKITTSEWYMIYCWYVNLAIFAIILGLLFLLVIIKQKKRVRKK